MFPIHLVESFMDEARNTDAIQRLIQDFIARNYKRSATLKEVRGEPSDVLRTDDERHRFATKRYGLVFDVEGIGQKIFLPVNFSVTMCVYAAAC